MGIAALTSMSTVSSGKEYTELFAAPAIDRTKGASCLHLIVYEMLVVCRFFISVESHHLFSLSRNLSNINMRYFFSVC